MMTGPVRQTQRTSTSFVVDVPQSFHSFYCSFSSYLDTVRVNISCRYSSIVCSALQFCAVLNIYPLMGIVALFDNIMSRVVTIQLCRFNYTLMYVNDLFVVTGTFTYRGS